MDTCDLRIWNIMHSCTHAFSTCASVHTFQANHLCQCYFYNGMLTNVVWLLLVHDSYLLQCRNYILETTEVVILHTYGSSPVDGNLIAAPLLNKWYTVSNYACIDILYNIVCVYKYYRQKVHGWQCWAIYNTRIFWEDI